MAELLNKKMERILNIEVLRIAKQKHTAVLMAVAALVLALTFACLPGTHAQYAQSDTDTHIFVIGNDKNLKIGITEDKWTVGKGEGMMPGTITEKNPVVKNLSDSTCYVRVNMRILDKDGNTLPADSERTKLILNTIWSNTTNLDKLDKPMSLNSLKSLTDVSNMCNSAKFDTPVWNDEMQAWSIAYKGADGSGKFASGETALFFDKIVVPTDYTLSDLSNMGDYYINIWAQAIQVDGYSNRDDALANLSNADVANDLSNVDNSKGGE